MSKEDQIRTNLPYGMGMIVGAVLPLCGLSPLVPIVGGLGYVLFAFVRAYYFWRVDR